MFVKILIRPGHGISVEKSQINWTVFFVFWRSLTSHPSGFLKAVYLDVGTRSDQRSWLFCAVTYTGVTVVWFLDPIYKLFWIEKTSWMTGETQQVQMVWLTSTDTLGSSTPTHYRLKAMCISILNTLSKERDNGYSKPNHIIQWDAKN